MAMVVGKTTVGEVEVLVVVLIGIEAITDLVAVIVVDFTHRVMEAHQTMIEQCTMEVDRCLSVAANCFVYYYSSIFYALNVYHNLTITVSWTNVLALYPHSLSQFPFLCLESFWNFNFLTLFFT